MSEREPIQQMDPTWFHAYSYDVFFKQVFWIIMSQIASSSPKNNLWDEVRYFFNIYIRPNLRSNFGNHILCISKIFGPRDGGWKYCIKAIAIVNECLACKHSLDSYTKHCTIPYFIKLISYRANFAVSGPTSGADPGMHLYRYSWNEA